MIKKRRGIRPMRNVYAAALSSKIFAKKVLKPKKGKGSYTRKGR